MRIEAYMGWSRVGVAILGACLLLALGCAKTEPPVEEVIVETPPAPVAQLPVSLNEVMVALVNHAADPIWVAAWHSPETDGDWRELERLSYQLEMAGALLTIPGTGPMDQQWTSDPGWRDYANQLREAGEGAVAAVQARDLEAISHSGDVIVEICEGCHFDFKPDMPTGGKFGEISPNEADIEQ